MYRAFKVKAGVVDTLPNISKIDFSKDLEEESAVRRFLTSKILDQENKLDGNEIQQGWFPTEEGKYQVFISHSHNDRGRACKLRDFFEACGIPCFVDSYVWGSADELNYKLNQCYNETGPNTFGYRTGQFISSHVHNILLNAIHQVIDSCECFIYLEPEDGIEENGVDDSAIFSTTLSPWLYSELRLISIIRSRKPQRLIYEQRGTKRFSSGADVQNHIDIMYKVDTSNFVELTMNEFMLVKAAKCLDMLYGQVIDGRIIETRNFSYNE